MTSRVRLHWGMCKVPLGHVVNRETCAYVDLATRWRTFDLSQARMASEEKCFVIMTRFIMDLWVRVELSEHQVGLGRTKIHLRSRKEFGSQRTKGQHRNHFGHDRIELWLEKTTRWLIKGAKRSSLINKPNSDLSTNKPLPWQNKT